MLLALAHLALVCTQPEPGWNFERRVDQGIEDVGVLNDSLRLMPMDLRIPDDWQQLYRLDSSRGPLFARRAGGLTAVFPESDYADTASGAVATIPASTIFVIGDPAPSLLRQLGLAMQDDQLLNTGLTRIDSSLNGALDGRIWSEVLPTRISTALDVTISPQAGSAEPDAPVRPVLDDQSRRDLSMWYNDDIRRHRVARLLEQSLDRHE